MEAHLAIAVAAVVTALVALAAAFAWYHLTGWTRFSYATGDAPRWGAPPGGVGRLRFSRVEFAVTRGDGATGRTDAAPALNSMAAAYAGGGPAAAAAPPALGLDRPLNPFSFVVPGWNDRAAVADPAAYPWATGGPRPATATLSGWWRAV